MTLWKMHCMEDRHPGLWLRWFKSQCVAAGWPPESFHLEGKTGGGVRWKRARTVLKRIEVGDHIVVALRGHRVGRIGEVARKAIGDDEWDPLVPKSAMHPDGEQGRRVHVRWDLTTGPDNRDLVIRLPEGKRLSSGELRPTACEIRSLTLTKLRRVMNDPENWVGVGSRFGYERSLSDYIASYPHRLEDGLVPYPSQKVREKVFEDASRLDVLLLDRDGAPVIVECKQGSPTLDNVAQLRHYMVKLKEETGKHPRGMLVHGGARKLRREVHRAAEKRPRIEIIQYQLAVHFTACR